MLAIPLPSHTVPYANCCMQDLALLRLRLSSTSKHNSLGCACRVKVGLCVLNIVHYVRVAVTYFRYICTQSLECHHLKCTA